MGLVVQKYGGTSVGSVERIAAVAERCIRAQRAGDQVAVVVSAMAGETNRLLGLGHAVSARPPARELDVLVSTGEQVSVALVAMAIDAAGGKARSFLGDQIAMRTDDRHGKARILSIDDTSLRASLGRGEIAVVAGFQGVDADGNITTLGRGGSDTSAVALAAALDADTCEIYTDVDGIYTADPNVCPDARRIDRIACSEMLELASLGAKVLQVRSVEFALNHDVVLRVLSSLQDGPGSWLVPNEEDMEKVTVRGVALNRDCAILTLRNMPTHPGTSASVFRPLAQAGINVDVIVRAAVTANTADLTFTVSRTELSQALELVGPIAQAAGGRAESEDEVAKVSVVGAGMRSQPGVAAQVFDVLGAAEIPIEIISTSEIKITCIVPALSADEAVRALHNSFGLSAD